MQHRHAFCCCDLDLDPVTLIYELSLDVLKMYLFAKNLVNGDSMPKLALRTIVTRSRSFAKLAIKIKWVGEQ